MAVLRIGGLPGQPAAAATAFYQQISALLKASSLAEVPARSADGGGIFAGQTLSDPPSGGPPCPVAEPLMLIFEAADHTHTGWRLAAIQSLARERAPQRVNGIGGGSAAATSAALAYLAAAAGVTGQYLPLADAGAGLVIPSAQ